LLMEGIPLVKKKFLGFGTLVKLLASIES